MYFSIYHHTPNTRQVGYRKTERTLRPYTEEVISRNEKQKVASPTSYAFHTPYSLHAIHTHAACQGIKKKKDSSVSPNVRRKKETTPPRKFNAMQKNTIRERILVKSGFHHEKSSSPPWFWSPSMMSTLNTNSLVSLAISNAMGGSDWFHILHCRSPSSSSRPSSAIALPS